MQRVPSPRHCSLRIDACLPLPATNKGARQKKLKDRRDSTGRKMRWPAGILHQPAHAGAAPDKTFPAPMGTKGKPHTVTTVVTNTMLFLLGLKPGQESMWTASTCLQSVRFPSLILYSAVFEA